MAKVYFELRKQSARGSESITADIMRHFHARQHLGKAVVVGDNPAVQYTAARKQWLKLSRAVQKMRAATLNADKILKYTHAITHMQRMHFTYKPPQETADADIYFLAPDQCTTLPFQCYSFYITAPIDSRLATHLGDQLPAMSLIVDYLHTTDWLAGGLVPKRSLEKQVDTAWRRVEQFLGTYNINPRKLIHKEVHDIDAMDDALDILLSIPYRFMDVATQFQRALELARPLRLSQNIRESYDAVVLLAHRVQALSPGAFTQQFLESYNEDDTFFLYDSGPEPYDILHEYAPAAIARHQAAGRHHLAQALQCTAGRRYQEPPVMFVVNEPVVRWTAASPVAP